MNVFLIGFMGSGKSSLGKKIASKLEMAFIDLDKVIEEKEKQSISQIFLQHGEVYFRELEKSVLFSIGQEPNAVVSLGGGACCNELSMSFLKQNGLTIYVKEDNNTLYGRLKKLKENRPLISHLSDAELKDFIKNKVEERSVYYDRADFIYEKKYTTLSFLVKQVKDYLR